MEAPEKTNLVAPPLRPAIRLRVAGKQLLLDGRFHHWTPVAMLSPAGDPGVVQILFDATSTSPTGDDGGAEELFSFTSRTVRRVGDSSFKVRGALRLPQDRDGEESKIEVIVQSPQGHSPFFFVTFPFDRDKHSDLWTHLGVVAANTVANEREMRPQAWLSRPTLAAA